MVRARLRASVKAVRQPAVWRTVAATCRLVRPLSRDRARWSYRAGYALEQAGRFEQSWAAYAAAAGPDGLPPKPATLDPVAVETARLLAVRRVRLRRHPVFRGLFTRRGRVIPVVPRAQRRRWAASAEAAAAAGDASPDEDASRDEQAAYLHHFYVRHRDHYLPRYFARAERYSMPRSRLARAWRWYVGDVLIQSAKLVRRNGRYVRRATGVPVRRQLGGMLWLSLRLPSMPENYYKYELYRPGHRAAADAYLHGHENSPVLYEALAEAAQRTTPGGTADAGAAAAPVAGEPPPLTDKVAFARRAEQAGLAVVPTLAVLTDGETVHTRAAELPRGDVFVKPLAGKGGRDVGRWTYDPDTDRFRGDGEAVGRDVLLQVLADRSVGQSHLVQPALRNHPELADLALDAVATCRIITITDEHGTPEPVVATFRMPAVPDTVVDNMHRGGIASPVDIDTGLLGAATDYAIAGPQTRHPQHPATSGAIEGRKLPLWEDAVALACGAHRAFAPRLLVGWDVSLGPDGPVLLEGNERPGVGGLQRLHDTALGSHRFGELLAHHLRRLEATW